VHAVTYLTYYLGEKSAFPRLFPLDEEAKGWGDKLKKAWNDFAAYFRKKIGTINDEHSGLSLDYEKIQERSIDVESSLENDYEVYKNEGEPMSPYDFLAYVPIKGLKTPASKETDKPEPSKEFNFGRLYGKFEGEVVTLEHDALACWNVNQKDMEDKSYKYYKCQKKIEGAYRQKVADQTLPDESGEVTEESNRFDLAFYYPTIWRLLLVNVWEIREGFLRGFYIRFVTQYFTAEYLIPSASPYSLAATLYSLCDFIKLQYFEAILTSLEPQSIAIDSKKFNQLMVDSINAVNTHEKNKKGAYLALCQRPVKDVIEYYRVVGAKAPKDGKETEIPPCDSTLVGSMEKIARVELPTDKPDVEVTVYASQSSSRSQKESQVTYKTQKKSVFDTGTLLKSFLIDAFVSDVVQTPKIA